MVLLEAVNPALPITSSITQESGDLSSVIFMLFGFVIVMVIMIAIFWFIETKGSRLFRLKNGVMRKIRFNDKDITSEGFLKVGPEEAIAIGNNPINLRNFFGSTNPTYFNVYPYPITLDMAVPDAQHSYITPAQVASGIDTLIMRELQTYREAKDSGAIIGFIAIGGILGMIVGFILPSFIGG